MILYHSYDIDVKNKNGIWLSETPQNEYGEKICSFIVDENKLKIADFKTTIKYILNYDLKNINDIIENEDECVAHCVGTDEIINYLDDGIPENEIFETVKQKAFDTNSISYVIFMEVMMHPFYHNFYKYMQKDNYDGYSFPFEYDPSDNYYFIFYPEKINKQINKKQNTMKIKLTESQLKQIVKETIENVLNEARGLNSMKLYNLITQHGGIGSSDYNGRFLQQIKDDDVIGVLSGDEYHKIVNKGRLATWAKNQGFNVDEKQIGWIYLNDGAMISYVLPENHSNMWYDEKHEKNRNEYMHPDGAKEYQWQPNGNKPSVWSPKGYTEDRKERFQTLQALQRRNKK